MKTNRIIQALFAFAVAAFGAAQLFADVVETKSGSHIVGKVVKIDAGSIVVATDFAGSITIKQSEVTAITTDAPVAVRLSSGTRLEGIVTSSATGVQVTNADATANTTIDKIAATWEAGGMDPEVAALQRVWAYEAAVDIVGKTGNSEQLGTAFSFRATLAGSRDKLQFYSAYNRQVTDGAISSDQLKAGVDYQNSFSGRKSWYLRDEAGFDRVKLIQFSNIAAFGLGYDFIKKPKQTFTGRLGLAHRFESYKADPVAFAALVNPLRPGGPLPVDQAKRIATKENVNAAGLDVGLSHSLELKNFSIVTRISYVPAFEDFSDFRASHETFLELPLRDPSWKLRMGVANDYTSKPAVGTERLDTTYFTRFVLSWK